MSSNRIHFVSLGCDKNLVDSEVMITNLWEKGYCFTDEEEAADIIVINTCCFIHDAKMESIEAILRLAEHKKSGKCKALIVTGCLSERYRNELRAEIPEVDAIVGVMATADICLAIENVLNNAKSADYFSEDGENREPVLNGKRIVTTGGHYAYLKIAEGCDKHCTYCIIPKIRGDYRSAALEKVLTDAVNLVNGGVKELILVAQETTLYGVDLYGRKMLPELLKKLCEIEGLKWIRLLYCYPEEITDELIEVLRSEPKICHYLDIPIQHGADGILKRMGRKANRNNIVDLIKKLRREIPDICLRTTLITGFPGESKTDHLENLRLIEEMKFDRLGVFTYSAEEDTPAAMMPGQVREWTKKRRHKKLMEKQQQIAFAIAAEMVGKRLEVMIEGNVADEDIGDEIDLPASTLIDDENGKVYVARTYRDAPGIDGYLFVKSERELLSGDFVEVLVTASYYYDLIGTRVEKSCDSCLHEKT
ncbi:MAG: 30S ribosomal protein S12 methylthiotransferase RimO [Lachnospiraceae bacterium]|nr:30S ribosomal protein S12 methylthiotransferase RimO [Lachnospiraceae bacterium]